MLLINAKNVFFSCSCHNVLFFLKLLHICLQLVKPYLQKSVQCRTSQVHMAVLLPVFPTFSSAMPHYQLHQLNIHHSSATAQYQPNIDPPLLLHSFNYIRQILTHPLLLHSFSYIRQILTPLLLHSFSYIRQILTPPLQLHSISYISLILTPPVLLHSISYITQISSRHQLLHTSYYLSDIIHFSQHAQHCYNHH